MATIHALFRQALQHQQAGNHTAAEQMCRQIVQADPEQADAWQLLGVVCSQSGNHATGLECIQRAIALKPTNAAFYGNAGIVYRSLGRTSDAIASYGKALELLPEFADAHNNLANLLDAQGDLDGALAHYQQAVRFKENFAEAYAGLGNVLRQKSRLDEAATYYQQAVRIKPNLTDAYFGLGLIFVLQGRLAEAMSAFRDTLPQAQAVEAHLNLAKVLAVRKQPADAVESYEAALRIEPGLVEALLELGTLLLSQGQVEQAIARFEKAIELRQDFAEAHSALGAARYAQFRYDEAAMHFQRTVELRPDYTPAIAYLASVLANQNKNDAAVECYEQVLRLSPDHREAHCNRALVLLKQGKFAEGWLEYEWRWRRKDIQPPSFTQPRWTGVPIPERAILLQSEQGEGDTLQFIRYAPLVKRLAGKVIVECAESLRDLIATCPGVDEVGVRGGPLGAFDYYAPLLSLPGIFRTSLENMPAEVPYLLPDPQLVDSWKQYFDAETALKIGINWQGNPDYGADSVRSFPLRHFAPIARLPNVRLYSLQVGAGREQVAVFASQSPLTDLGDQLGDFQNTAAAVMNLDLVISSDFAMAHLAGALAKPVWVALAYSADWRWLLERTDCPWYPTMRLFRQARPGDWEGVFEELRAKLEKSG